MHDAILVRPATGADMPAVATIFGWYVTETVATFELEPPTASDWLERLDQLAAGGWPFLVAALGDEVVGYAYVAPWRTKPAYRYTVEDSVYLAPGHTGHGYGRVLLRELLTAAAAAGARQVVAVIPDTGSPASTVLHRAVGFTEAGRLRQVGYKHGRWLDVVLLQAALAPPRPP